MVKRKFRRDQQETRPRIKRTKWNKRRQPLKRQAEEAAKQGNSSEDQEVSSNVDNSDGDLDEVEDDNLPALRLLTATFARDRSHDIADAGSADREAPVGSTAKSSQSPFTKAPKKVIPSTMCPTESENDVGEQGGSEDAKEDAFSVEDPYVRRFEKLLTEQEADLVKKKEHVSDSEISLPILGSLTVKSIKNIGTLGDLKHGGVPLEKSHVRQRLVNKVSSLSNPPWTATSGEVFSIISTYRDFFHFEKDYRLDDDIMRAYCLHTLNHVLKSRSRVLDNNAKLEAAQQKDPTNADATEFRDQGFTRPKVLIIVPFKHHAFRIYRILSDLITAKDFQVMHKARFEAEFDWQEKDPVATSDRPDDFRATFAGNTDDCFRLGISVTKRSLKMYADFYAADVIIASPLGLRMIIGTEGEKQHEYDFLSSVEVLILDQADIFMMQNWEHISWIMKHLHRQPKSTEHMGDVTRAWQWILDGWGPLYRQTIFLSAFRCPEFQAFVGRSCSNFAGSVCVKADSSEYTLSSVVVPIPHCFHRIPGNDCQKVSDARFKHFVEKILPQLNDVSKAQTMIFIPSYFDFVRIRNHFKREDVSFVQICEYTSTAKIARARDLFYHGKKHFLLYTERFHFYRRYRIKGIRHILFYDLPHYPHFYPELCNMMMGGEETAFHQFTSDVLYSKFDAFQLVPVVGQTRAATMLQPEKSVHMFVTSPSDNISLP